MKKMLSHCVLVVFLIMLTGCNLTLHPVTDPFYTSTGDLERVRFPLLKPYEVLNNLDGRGWYINLPSEADDQNMIYINIEKIDEIAIQGDDIMVHTPLGDLFTSTGTWFVLIPSQHTQQVFKDPDKFEEYVTGFGLDKIRWESPDALNKRFISSGCLDWIPECK